MYELIKKIHMYAGLLTFLAFVVWGVTGIEAVFLPQPGGWTPPQVSAEREFPFEAPGDLDDKQLAKRIYEISEIPLAGGHYNVRRDDDANLAFFVFTTNGRRDVTYLEGEKKVNIKIRRNDLGGFLSTMHTAHTRRGPPELSVRLWGVYNEISTWAFFFMTLSGVYMWVAARPRVAWAQWTFGAAVASFAILWATTR